MLNEKPTPLVDLDAQAGPAWLGAHEEPAAAWHEHLRWNWDAYRYFVVLARCGVMRRAAEQLDVSVATFSRRIEQLEVDLGMCLFHRRPQGITLTSTGAQLLQHCEQICDAFGSLEEHMKGKDTGLMHHVRLRIDSMLARVVLPGLLPFIGVGIGVTVDIATANCIEWQAGDFDISIGFARPESGSLLIRRLADLTMSMAIAISLVGSTLAGIFKLDFIDGAWRGKQGARSGVAAINECHLENMVDLVRQGVGIAMLPDYVIDSEPDLVRFTSSEEVFSQPVLPIWMVIRETAVRSNAVRTLADLCGAAIRQRFAPAPAPCASALCEVNA